jgi:alpha-ribazole phosphatase
VHLYLIRHTRVAAAAGICYGRTDVPVADDFADEARRLAAQLPAVSRLHTSPASRCRMLADTLAGHHTPVDVDPRLQELDFGDWENRPWAEIDGPEARAWGDDFVRRPCPEGESYEQLAARVSTWADELPAADVAVAAVTHGGPVRALLAHLLRLPLDRAFAFTVDCGSLTVLRRHGVHWTAEVVNRRLDEGYGEGPWRRFT